MCYQQPCIICQSLLKVVESILMRFCRIPWDVETALGQDNTLGGKPGDLWCILACEQWNSPLYCDSEHPQVRPLGPGLACYV